MKHIHIPKDIFFEERASFLRFLGLTPLPFDVAPPNQGKQHLSEPPSQCLKGRIEAMRCAAPKDLLPVLFIETFLLCGRRILGQPRDDEEALAMLSLLSGRRHRLYTAFALGFQGKIHLTHAHVKTAVLHPKVQQFLAGQFPLYPLKFSWKTFLLEVGGDPGHLVGTPCHSLAGTLRGAGLL